MYHTGALHQRLLQASMPAMERRIDPEAGRDVKPLPYLEVRGSS